MSETIEGKLRQYTELIISFVIEKKFWPIGTNVTFSTDKFQINLKKYFEREIIVKSKSIHRGILKILNLKEDSSGLTVEDWAQFEFICKYYLADCTNNIYYDYHVAGQIDISITNQKMLKINFNRNQVAEERSLYDAIIKINNTQLYNSIDNAMKKYNLHFVIDGKFLSIRQEDSILNCKEYGSNIGEIFRELIYEQFACYVPINKLTNLTQDNWISITNFLKEKEKIGKLWMMIYYDTNIDKVIINHWGKIIGKGKSFSEAAQYLISKN